MASLLNGLLIAWIVIAILYCFVRFKNRKAPHWTETLKEFKPKLKQNKTK